MNSNDYKYKVDIKILIKINHIELFTEFNVFQLIKYKRLNDKANSIPIDIYTFK